MAIYVLQLELDICFLYYDTGTWKGEKSKPFYFELDKKYDIYFV